MTAREILRISTHRDGLRRESCGKCQNGPLRAKARAPLNMRTTAALREKLEAAAGEVSGRSLVQEVESRLEQSFATDALLGSKWSELPRLITLAIAIAPKGAHRAKALQTATRLISDAFFGGGFSAEETKRHLPQHS